MKVKYEFERVIASTITLIAAVLITLLASGCGGGGGGSGSGTGNGSTTGGSSGADVPTLAVFAGNMRIPKYVDGIGSSAGFISPFEISADSAGNVYVTDYYAYSIRKITPAGIVTTFAGNATESGSADGGPAAARFGFQYTFKSLMLDYKPGGTAVDSTGNVYVADAGNHTIRKIGPDGVVTTLAGTAGKWGSSDGVGAAARFSYPYGIAVDSAGNVFVADSGNRTIRKISPSGQVTTLAGGGDPFVYVPSADGTGAAARFYFPTTVATDNAGNLYVAEGDGTIRKVTAAGVVTTLVGKAGESGIPIPSQPNFSDLPIDITTDNAGNLYVADKHDHTIREITSAGAVSTVAGTPGKYGSADGVGAAARFNNPRGIATDGVGNIYVCDSGNGTIRKITPAGAVTTLAGRALTGNDDGIGESARFAGPEGIATDKAGNVYVADGINGLRKITTAGLVSTIAGTVGPRDGSEFLVNSYIAIDSAGNIYMSDRSHHIIRKISPDGVVTTLAGMAGESGANDGTGTAARFSGPDRLATDSGGNIYVAEESNSTIRKVTPGGVVTTLAGTALVYGHADGVGAAARFWGPNGIAVDSANNLYVTDNGNAMIRKITPDGVVTTLAGGSRGWTDGTGAGAAFFDPRSIASDSAGNLYVVDTQYLIRKVTPAGVVTTVARGTGQFNDEFVPGPLSGTLPIVRDIAISGRSLYMTARQGVAVITNLP